MKSAPSQKVRRERSAHPLPSQRCSCTSGRAPFCTATPWQQLSRALIAANPLAGLQPLRNPARPSAGTASSKPKAPFMKWKSKSGPLPISIRIPPERPTSQNLRPPWTPPAALPLRVSSFRPRVSQRPASKKLPRISRSPCATSPTPVKSGPACVFKPPSTQIPRAKSFPSSSPGIRSHRNSGGSSSASPFVGAICLLTELSFRLNVFSRKNCGARQPSCRFSFLAIPLAALKVNPFVPDARETAHSAQSWCNVNPLESTLIEPLVSVENKLLTETLSSLKSTLTKTWGWGPPSIQPSIVRPMPKYHTRKNVACYNQPNHDRRHPPSVRRQIR